MSLTLLIGIVLGIMIIIWLSSLRINRTPQGELMALKFFDKHIAIVGSGIPEIPINPDHLPPNVTIDIRVDGESSIYVTIWPWSIESFEYRYKRFRTLATVENADNKGEVVWQPTMLKDKKVEEGEKPKKKKQNDPNTIVLGEWKESSKRSIHVREREEIVIPFLSKDRYKGVVHAYLKFIVWDMSLAISSTHNFKSDPEKAVIDWFQRWAREKSYLEHIQGVSFNDLNGANDFYRRVNSSIWKTGVILEDVDLFFFYLEPESLDLIEEGEKRQKALFGLETAKINAETKEKEGEGEKRKQLQINLGQQNKLEIEAKVEVEKDLNLKKNEVTQEEELKKIEVTKDKGLKENQTTQYAAMKEIDVKNAGKLITRLEKYKKVVDETEVQKMDALSSLRGTLILHEKGSNSGSNLDDALLENSIIANAIQNSKTKKGGES